MAGYMESLTEEGLCDEIVRWFVAYKAAMGLARNEVKLVLVNRRWGKQLRRFGPTLQEVLRRDGRFAFQPNAGGGMNVSVETELTREQALERRRALDAAFGPE